jgi:hypothetical protein
LQNIGDARIEIEETGVELEAVGPVDATSPPRRREILAWIAAGIGVAMASAFGVLRFRGSTEVPAVRPLALRLDVDLGPDALLLSAGGPTAILSPDGTRLVFVVARTGIKASLFTRRLDQPNATEVAGTSGASGPFFSPNGQWRMGR